MAGRHHAAARRGRPRSAGRDRNDRGLVARGGGGAGTARGAGRRVDARQCRDSHRHRPAVRGGRIVRCRGSARCEGLQEGNRVPGERTRRVREAMTMNPVNVEAERARPAFGRRDPDARGYFGAYGGRFVPETLVAPIEELTAGYFAARADASFRAELERLLTNYVGR